VQEKSLRRLAFISAMLLGFMLVLVIQLVRWQAFEHFRVSKRIKEMYQAIKVIAPQRGLIKDRDGYLLATNSFQCDVVASPNMISNPREVADQLWPLLDLPRQQLVEALDGDESYVPLKRGLPLEIGEAISDLGLMGIDVRVRARRAYPGKTLAAHVLGFVDFNGNGFYGLEEKYNGLLKGKPGRLEWSRLLGFSKLVSSQDGYDLILTLDRTIQFMVEQELARGVKEFQAEGGTVIVMEPRTGAILAMANYPAYDPNLFYATLPELFVNSAISEEYEPGSVFKIITVASGIEAGVISQESIFYDEGSIEIGENTIRNWDGKAYGRVSLADVLAYSLNVECVKISQALGARSFYEYVQRFGFGQLTGVDLAGEIAGELKLPGDGQWHESDLGTNSFGQGIAVTSLQMVTAIAAVANDGLLMKPHIVEAIADGEKIAPIRPEKVRQVISKATAHEVTALLAEAIPKEAPAAQVEGYSIAGKTGTAQVPGHGSYRREASIASFVGYAPPDDPAFVMLVKVDNPRASPWGSKVAAPIFKRIAERLLSILGVPPDYVRLACANSNG